VHVIALGAGQSVFELHEMVHSIFVIIAKGLHSPEVQSDAWVHVMQRSAGTPPSPPELLPLLEPLELPELLPLLEPLELPELLPLLEPLELPELLPVLDPLELPEELPLPEPLSASDPELEPGPLGPDDEELEQAGIHRTRSVDVAAARVRRSLMHSRMTRGAASRQLLSTQPREMFHGCSFRVTTRVEIVPGSGYRRGPATMVTVGLARHTPGGRSAQERRIRDRGGRDAGGGGVLRREQRRVGAGHPVQHGRRHRRVR
jgi:hypothetical protein